MRNGGLPRRLPEIHPRNETYAQNSGAGHASRAFRHHRRHPAARRLGHRASAQRFARRHRRGAQTRSQRYLLPRAVRHGAVRRRAQERKIRRRAHGGAHHPVGRRLPRVQLYPAHPQGAQGGISESSRHFPQFFGTGKGQRIPDEPQNHLEARVRHLLRGYAHVAVQPVQTVRIAGRGKRQGARRLREIYRRKVCKGRVPQVQKGDARPARTLFRSRSASSAKFTSNIRRSAIPIWRSFCSPRGASRSCPR